MIVFLDSNILGLISNTNSLFDECQQCEKWFYNLWARASNEGLTTRDDKNIDVDIIISAQYQILEEEYPGQRVVVATTNLKHLSRFCDAARWQDIKL